MSTPRSSRGCKRQLEFIIETASAEKVFKKSTPSKISTRDSAVAVGTIYNKYGVLEATNYLDNLRTIPVHTPKCRLDMLLSDFPLQLKEWVREIQDDEMFATLFAPTTCSEPALLLPPVSLCINCSDPLEINNQATEVKVITGNGVKRILKQSLRCKGCKVNYNYSMFGNKKAGSRFYNEKRPLIEGNDMFFMTRDMYNLMVALRNHAWVSSETYAEAYNDTFNCFREGIDRRQLGDLFHKGEVEAEIRSRQLVESTLFKSDSDFENVMDVIEKLRSNELYPHESCPDDCEKRGCGKLWVADGIWKLIFPHCMMVQKNTSKCAPNANFPDICPGQLQPGKAFCKEHVSYLTRKNIPTGLRAFLKYCGISGDSDSTSEDSETSGTFPTITISLAEEVKIRNKLFAIDHDHGYSSLSLQTYGLPEQFGDTIVEVCDKEPVLSSESTATCKHEVGDHQRMRKFSRGHFFVVRAGGHIDTWTPLYQSEGTGQVFLIVISWLFRLLKDVEPSEWSKIWLAYDNMCNLLKLNAAKQKLAIEPPYDELFTKIKKCVDGLHIKNHVDPICKTTLHPDLIFEMYPELRGTRNTMAAEQTFVWAARFKKIVCSMTKRHHLFFMHRMIVHRNNYTRKCHELGRKPVLPGIKI